MQTANKQNDFYWTLKFKPPHSANLVISEMAVLFVNVIVYVLTFLVAYFGLKLIWKKKCEKNCLPCLPTLPIVGSLPFLPGLPKLHAFFQEKAKELGNIFAFKMCNRYVVVLNGRKAIQEALVKQSLIFADRPQLYLTNYFEEYKGFIEHPYDEDFKKLHKVSLNLLKKLGFGQVTMESRIRVEVDSMLSSFRSKDGQAFNPINETITSVSNVICSIIYGRRWSIDDPKFHEGNDIAHRLVKQLENIIMVNYYPIIRFLPNFNKAIKIHIKLLERWRVYITSVLEGIADADEEDSFYKTLKKELETDADDCKKDEIKERLIAIIKDFLIAGTETTSTFIQWFFLLMANSQNIQKQIRNEIDQAVGLDRHPSLDDRPNLPLLEATLLEMMRYRTVIPLPLAHSTLKDTYLSGMFIPANTVIFLNLYSCHMDPAVWKEPEKFDISRFLDETKTKVINKDQVVSFSFGKRSCLGEMLARQEMFLFASALVHEFEIHPPIGQDRIDDRGEVALVYSPGPFKIRVVRRPLNVMRSV